MVTWKGEEMTGMEIITGHDIMQEICEKLDLKHVRRLIIDLSYDDVGKIYVELLTDRRLYEVDFGKMEIKNCEVNEFLDVSTVGDKFQQNILKGN